MERARLVTSLTAILAAIAVLAGVAVQAASLEAEAKRAAPQIGPPPAPVSPPEFRHA